MEDPRPPTRPVALILRVLVVDPGDMRTEMTDVVVTAGHAVRSVDGLLTGWHEPEASHLLMLEAFARPETLARAYRTALDLGYLWHEFGDSHLILRQRSARGGA